MIKLIYANAETSMLSGEQIGAHSVRSVTGARNVRRLISGETKPPGSTSRANRPLPARLADRFREPDRGNRISLFRRMSSLFTSNKFPVWLGQGIAPQCTEMAAQIDTRRRQARQKKAKFPVNFPAVREFPLGLRYEDGGRIRTLPSDASDAIAPFAGHDKSSWC